MTRERQLSAKTYAWIGGCGQPTTTRGRGLSGRSEPRIPGEHEHARTDGRGLDWESGSQTLPGWPSWARGCGWLMGLLSLMGLAHRKKKDLDFSKMNFHSMQILIEKLGKY
jgi:hypothetical protein